MYGNKIFLVTDLIFFKMTKKTFSQFGQKMCENNKWQKAFKLFQTNDWNVSAIKKQEGNYMKN